MMYLVYEHVILIEKIAQGSLSSLEHPRFAPIMIPMDAVLCVCRLQNENGMDKL